MPKLSKVLDRIVSDPVLMRRLKGNSGQFKIKAGDQFVLVNWEKSQAGHVTFNTSVDEETNLAAH